MKKFFMVAVMAVAALAANAQVWIGGSLGFKSEKATSDDDATTTFSIAPELGYNFNEKWAVGLNLAFETSKAGDADASNSFGVAPFARYTFASCDKVSFFLDGGIGFKTYNNEGGNTFNVGIAPGIKFQPCEKISLTAQLGQLGYSKNSDKRGGGSEFGFGVDNTQIKLGVYYNL